MRPRTAAGELWAGRAAERTFVVTEAQIDAFADLTGDRHPIHLDREYARAQGFSDRIAHGLLLGGLVSQVIGMELPGASGLLQELRLSFRSPCYPGTRIAVRVAVREHVASVDVLRLEVTISQIDGALLAKGSVQSGLRSRCDNAGE